jgi:hypothetical protein
MLKFADENGVVVVVEKKVKPKVRKEKCLLKKNKPMRLEE